MLRNAFFWKLDPHPPPRNANNIEPYTFVSLFPGKSDTPHPHLRYVTLEWPLSVSYLVLIKVLVYEFILSLLLECDDDESDEDVDEEEREDDEVDDVEYGHLHAVAGRRSLILKRRVHRVLQHPANT